MRVGVLTGGGDCPGLNAVIRALVRRGTQEYGHEFIGFRDGWRGPLEGDTVPLDVQAVRGILPRGGTILGSSRTNPLADGAAGRGRSGVARISANLDSLGVDALIAGMAGGANVILIPEKPFDIEKVCAYVEHRFQTRYAPIVVVAEGARPVDGDAASAGQQLDSFGHVRLGGAGQMLADEI